MSKREKYLKTTYGLSLAQYKKMLRIGNFACWICKKKKRRDGKPLKLFVEHCHKTGRVRGIACFRCNKRLIGQHQTGELLRRVADYLDNTFDGREL